MLSVTGRHRCLFIMKFCPVFGDMYCRRYNECYSELQLCVALGKSMRKTCMFARVLANIICLSIVKEYL